jgi:hypothetical protein
MAGDGSDRLSGALFPREVGGPEAGDAPSSPSCSQIDWVDSGRTGARRADRRRSARTAVTRTRARDSRWPGSVAIPFARFHGLRSDRNLSTVAMAVCVASIARLKW